MIRTLSRGAHAPGGLYPDRVPFEVAMEEIRGHYRIDVNNTGAPDMVPSDLRTNRAFIRSTTGKSFEWE